MPGEPEELFDGYPPDLNRFLFRNQEFESGLIELQELDEHGIREVMLGGTSYTPLSVEPGVERMNRSHVAGSLHEVEWSRARSTTIAESH